LVERWVEVQPCARDEAYGTSVQSDDAEARSSSRISILPHWRAGASPGRQKKQLMKGAKEGVKELPALLNVSFLLHV
jgi:hypothetical protein